MAEGQDPESGKFVKGNQLWRLSLNKFGKYGRTPNWTDAEKLIEEAAGYFEYLDENPFEEAGIYGKDAKIKTLPKMRAPTIKGLCSYLGIPVRTWSDMRRKQEELIPAIEFLEQLIWNAKFEGAASGFLTPAVIMREMGLAESQQISGPNGGPVEVKTEHSDMEIARRLAFVMAQALEKQKEQAENGDSEAE